MNPLSSTKHKPNFVNEKKNERDKIWTLKQSRDQLEN